LVKKAQILFYLENDTGKIGNGKTIWNPSVKDGKITFTESFLGIGWFGGKKTTRKLRKNKHKLHNKTGKSIRVQKSMKVKRGRKSSTKTTKHHSLKSKKRGGDDAAAEFEKNTIENMKTIFGNPISLKQKEKLYEIVNMIPKDSPIRDPNSKSNFLNLITASNNLYKEEKEKFGRGDYDIIADHYSGDEKNNATEKDPILLNFDYVDSKKTIFLENNGTVGDGFQAIWPKYNTRETELFM
jgi:hypothetical protein